MNAYEREITRLYAAQAEHGHDYYLYAHSRNRAVIRRQTHSFELYADYLKGARRILDWGCRQGADACLARMLLGSDVTIDGCDIDAADYRAFFSFANLRYTKLTHPYQLPYQDAVFDAVISSGTLEHVPQESASLAEIHRITKEGGQLIITFLPNSLSYVEALQRLLRGSHHSRRYSVRRATRLLLEHGFVPVKCGYHQFLPTLSSPRRGGLFESRVANVLAENLLSLNAVLEAVWPVRCFSTNLFIIARKVAVLP
jgi:SAM-dependent methyltransferase